jgi:hypothetical protein
MCSWAVGLQHRNSFPTVGTEGIISGASVVGYRYDNPLGSYGADDGRERLG